MKRLILLFLLILITKSNMEASIIQRNNEKTFSVNAVRVEGVSFENEQTTKQTALEQARQIAFNDLIKYLKFDNLSFDEVNINSAISSYSIVDEYYNENFYSLIANFVFDADIIKSIIRKTRENTDKKGEIADYVVVLKENKDLIKEYMMLNNFLKKEKILSYPIKIEQDEISFLLQKVDKNNIYSSLKLMDLNGKIYAN